MRRPLTLVMTSWLIVAGLAPLANAEETICRRTFGRTTLDNVKVPCRGRAAGS